MVSTSTKLNRNEDLIELLQFDHAATRMLALHILCEGYATSEVVLQNVFKGWDCWGAREAFSEFPMLSHIPIHVGAISEALQRAHEMVQGRKLTEPESRCAGKLIEQLVRLPASDLQTHQDALAKLKASSKIFFRVDLNGLEERIQLLGRTGDELAAVLDDCIARLVSEPNDGSAMQRGLAALEALRREHPDYLDLRGVFTARQSLLGAGSEVPDPSPSFTLTLASLIQAEQLGLEGFLAEHLIEESESIFTAAVEALVRCGSREAAIAMIDMLPKVPSDNQKWIARGLQRFRGVGLSPQISKLRNDTTDPRLWLMLLIAEARQFEPESVQRLVADLERLQSPSETLLETLRIYVLLNQGTSAGGQLAMALDGYVQRTGLGGNSE